MQHSSTDDSATDPTNAPNRASTHATGPRRASRNRRPRPLLLAVITITGLTLAAGGCVSVGPTNPAWPDKATINADLRRMRNDPVQLERPIVLLGGYRAPASNAHRLERNIIRFTSQDRDDFLAVSYPFGTDIDTIARQAIDRIEERWPSDDPDATVEVDVLAISMGGLVARHAALPPAQRFKQQDEIDQPADADDNAPTKRLRIRNLYTFGTPHRGASLAKVINFDNASRAMIPDSPYIQHLNEVFARGVEYTLTPYAHTRDGWVGVENTSPPGTHPIWARGSFMFSHFRVSENPRFLADVSRRLRREPPIVEEGTPPVEADPPPRNPARAF